MLKQADSKSDGGKLQQNTIRAVLWKGLRLLDYLSQSKASIIL